MKIILSSALILPLLCACATSGPTTSWGKEGVSMSEYRLDGAQCAVLAASSHPENSVANSAGGINGRNSSVPNLPTVVPGGTPPAPGTAVPTSGNVYRESASPDFVSRAANQQRAQELAIQRLRTDALKSCLVDRGYTEFPLTPEQRKQLATLAEGSDARREYLYKLATDPATLAKGNPK